MRSSKKIETWNVIYIWFKQLKNIFCIFWSWHLGCIKVLTIYIAMRNLVNYDSAGPVTDRHSYAESSELQIHGPLCRPASPCGTRWTTNNCSANYHVPIGIPMRNLVNCKYAYMVNCADSSWFAGNRIRLPIGTVTLKHSKLIWNDETCFLNFTDCSSYK